jgi:hypothetical protein
MPKKAWITGKLLVLDRHAGAPQGIAATPL